MVVQKEAQKLVEVQRISVSGVLSYKTTHLLSHPLSKAQGPERKVVSVRGREDQGEAASSGCESITHDTQQLCVPAQDQASQHSSMSSQGADETPALTEVLCPFSLRVWLLVSQPCSKQHNLKLVD